MESEEKPMDKCLKGLFAAVVSSVASGVVLLIADPYAFSDWEKLAKTSLALGVWGLCMYLKQSPIPKYSKSKGTTVDEQQ